jgi:ribosome biogenesis GTP-binding protein YsxC/EngB
MKINIQKTEFIRSAAKSGDFPADERPQITFAGRSNVGKSSVINCLLNRKNFARVGNSPGKTAFINFFLVDEAFYLVDLPGYGYAKVSKAEKERWGRLIEGYFDDTSQMSLGVQIVDARHKPTADDCQMANWFLYTGKPFIVIANKLDKLKKSEVAPNLQRIQETLQLPEEVKLIPFAAIKGTGRDELLAEIFSHVNELPDGEDHTEHEE